MTTDPGDETQPQVASSSQPSGSRRPIYRVETTGHFWQDAREAFKRISIADDFQRLGEIPCARNSLMSGIASGVGVGVIRIMSAGFLVGSHWAVGTFMLVSLGTWTVCQRNIEVERRKLQKVVEDMPKRFIKQKDVAADPSGAS
ncbi:hypothetical protein AZE42_00209 [Rhizopogon vesiculosus]|uniref:Cytochrome c oxidase assembly protein COX20, mitochondrial n=1 Tax=Rhizopogon vesiculosus TaxID=180088 RepID=A0A1J8R634_9AGAM|nr:hypothetical protein AZE42_00209 [Rhizopogon vesiculosus]